MNLNLNELKQKCPCCENGRVSESLKKTAIELLEEFTKFINRTVDSNVAIPPSKLFVFNGTSYHVVLFDTNQYVDNDGLAKTLTSTIISYNNMHNMCCGCNGYGEILTSNGKEFQELIAKIAKMR